MNISEAAQATGLSSKTIRFYEDKGIIPKAQRRANGYRFYTQAQLEALIFVRRAKGLGFSLDECRDLLALQHSADRTSSEVKAKVDQQLQRIEQQIKDLSDMRQVLLNLYQACPGDMGRECPILDELSRTDTASIRRGSEE